MRMPDKGKSFDCHIMSMRRKVKNINSKYFKLCQTCNHGYSFHPLKISLPANKFHLIYNHINKIFIF